MDRRTTIAAVGGVALLAGEWLPTSTIAYVGRLTYWTDDRTAAWIVALLALIAVVLAATRQVVAQAIVGGIALALVAWSLVDVSVKLHGIQQNVAQGMAAQGLALSAADRAATHLEWGWLILFAGAAMLVASPFARPRGIATGARFPI